MYQITPALATHGLGERNYPTNFENLEHGKIGDFWIHDVRWMKDEYNPRVDYDVAINMGIQKLSQFGKVVVCCGAGQSRSNAIALGMLVRTGMDFYEAWSMVRDRVPICQIEPCHISALKKLFGVTLP